MRRRGLEGSAVIVTGAAGGIGSAVAVKLAELGCEVWAVDTAEAELAATVEALPGSSYRWRYADVRDVQLGSRLTSEIADSGRPLVGLCHLAALLRRRHSLELVTEDDWDCQMDTNLKGMFFLNRAVGSYLVERGTGGSIVNLTSQGWWTGGLDGSIVYAASKGGVVTITRSLARTWAPRGVRVNAVAPGFVDTQMMRSGLTDAQLTTAASLVPLGRLASSEDIVDGAISSLAHRLL